MANSQILAQTDRPGQSGRGGAVPRPTGTGRTYANRSVIMNSPPTRESYRLFMLFCLVALPSCLVGQQQDSAGRYSIMGVKRCGRILILCPAECVPLVSCWIPLFSTCKYFWSSDANHNELLAMVVLLSPNEKLRNAVDLIVMAGFRKRKDFV